MIYQVYPLKKIYTFVLSVTRYTCTRLTYNLIIKYTSYQIHIAHL